MTIGQGAGETISLLQGMHVSASFDRDALLLDLSFRSLLSSVDEVNKFCSTYSFAIISQARSGVAA